MALARVAGSIGGRGTDLLISPNLVQKLGQDGRIADIAAGDLEGSDLQHFLINCDMYPAPDAALRAIMLACIPLTFALGLDACAVDLQVQRARPSTAGDRPIQHSLAATQGTEVRHQPGRAGRL